MSDLDKLEHLIENPQLVKRVAVVTFYGRSGSYLLSSMFDWHPEVLTVSVDGLYDFFKTLIPFLNERLKSGQVDLEHLINFLVDNFPNFFSGLKRAAESQLQTEEFRSYFTLFVQTFARVVQNFELRSGRDGMEATCFEIFLAMHLAYAKVLKREILTENPLIFWQQHLPIDRAHRDQLRRIFPETFFIKMIRQPEKTLDSHIHHHYAEFPLEPLSELFKVLYKQLTDFDCVFEGVDGENSFAVRFEDLHVDTRGVMTKLAQNLGISWKESLLESTENGLPYGFVNREGKRISGTNPNAAKNLSTKYLSTIDRIKIRYVLEKNYREWDYSRGRIQFLLNISPVRWLLFRIPLKYDFILFKEDLRTILNDLRRALGKLFERGREHNEIIHQSKRGKNKKILPLLKI